jgi:hypothetical protein
MAPSVNSSCAPRGPRNLSRPSRKMRMRVGIDAHHAAEPQRRVVPAPAEIKPPGICGQVLALSLFRG